MLPNTLSFVLLSPVAGAIAGALGVVGVCTFYFLKLRRRPMRVGSTMLWEQAVRDMQVNTPFRMIRPSWLLALQLLAVILLALAVARPAIDRPDASDRLVILLDRSASMQARDEGSDVSRFEVAKQRIETLLDRANASTKITLLSFSGDARTEIPFTQDVGTIKRALSELSTTDGPSDLSVGLELAEAITASAATGDESTESIPSTRLIIASDGGVSVRAGSGATLPNTTVEYLVCAQPDQAAPENIGIINAAAARDPFIPERVRVFVEFASNQTEPSMVRFGATLNGEPIAAETVELTPRDTFTAGSASFEISSEERSVVRMELISDDALKSDNIAHIVLEPYRPVQVDLVTASGTVQTNGDAALYDALIAAGARTVTAVTAANVRSDGESEEVARLHVYSSVSPTVSSAVPELLFGTSFDADSLSAVVAEDAGAERFAFWRRNHPILRYAGLSDVVFAGGYRYRAADDDDSQTARIETLASAETGDVLMLHEQGIKRRLLVGIDLSRTTWWRSPSFIIFIKNALDTLTSRAERVAGKAHSTGKPITLSVPGSSFSGVNAFVLTRGDNTIGELSARADGTISLDKVEQAGLYSVRDTQDGSLSSVFGVSMLNQDETLLLTADAIPVAGQQVSAATTGQLSPAEIWKWFVLAALLVASVEWIFFVRGVKPG